MSSVGVPNGVLFFSCSNWHVCESRAGSFVLIETLNCDMIRMVVDARCGNIEFPLVPGISMCTSESFSRVGYGSPDDVSPCSCEAVDALSRAQVFLGICDVEQCFHRLCIDMALSQYVCLLAVQLKHVAPCDRLVDGAVLD